MDKNIANNSLIMDKKIFIAGKVYDLQVMDKNEVEASVQAYLDSGNRQGQGKVRAMHNRKYDRHVLPPGI